MAGMKRNASLSQCVQGSRKQWHWQCSAKHEVATRGLADDWK